MRGPESLGAPESGTAPVRFVIPAAYSHTGTQRASREHARKHECIAPSFLDNYEKLTLKFIAID